jgi:hypothetical protein
LFYGGWDNLQKAYQEVKKIKHKKQKKTKKKLTSLEEAFFAKYQDRYEQPTSQARA